MKIWKKKLENIKQIWTCCWLECKICMNLEDKIWDHIWKSAPSGGTWRGELEKRCALPCGLSFLSGHKSSDPSVCVTPMEGLHNSAKSPFPFGAAWGKALCICYSELTEKLWLLFLKKFVWWRTSPRILSFNLGMVQSHLILFLVLVS